MARQRGLGVGAWIAVVVMAGIEVFLIWSVYFQTRSGYESVTANTTTCQSSSGNRDDGYCDGTFTYQGRDYTVSDLKETHGNSGSESIQVQKSALDGRSSDIPSSAVAEQGERTGRIIWIYVLGGLLVLLVALRVAIFVKRRRLQARPSGAQLSG